MKEEALKLADELASYYDSDYDKAEAMIRRLVEELKAKNNYLAQHCSMIDEQQKEIKNLEDAVKNALIYINNHKKTKPLSDEEINEIKTLMEINYGCVPPLEFAWAIEERHGIK